MAVPFPDTSSPSNNARPVIDGSGHPPPPKPPHDELGTDNNNIPSTTKYDAFISFRGEDIRDNFLSHLFAHLNDVKKLDAFKDDVKLRGGDEISPSLSQAIEASASYIVVLSPNYATSKWCLDELVKITECRTKHGRKVIPVFYDGVDPSNVRNQSGSFGVALSQHEKVLPKDMMGRVERWRAALREVANLSGFDSTVIKNENELIKKIAESVMDAIIPTITSVSPPQECLVGIDSQIGKIEQLLCFHDLQLNWTIGLSGMGGIGKTTLARTIFDLHSSQFEASYFLQDFTKQLKSSSLADLQDKLFSSLLGDQNSRAIPWEMQRRRLSRLRALVVVDDVAETSARALDDLLKGSWCELFGRGSRVLLTSRDQQVLKTASPHKMYGVEGLDHDKGLQLFSLSTFQENRPPEEYLDKCKRVVSYASGNPLALKVMGRDLRKRSLEYWDGVLGKLAIGSGSTEKEIEDMLKISYDGLKKQEQCVFLDIACLFNHESWRSVWKNVLDGNIVTKLIDKCLLSISDSSGLIEMHGLLEDLGKNIVKQEQELGKRSRLWDADEAATLFNQNMGTSTTEGIFLDLGETKEDVYMAADAFERMRSLRLLRIQKQEVDEPFIDAYGFYVDHNSNRKVEVHWWWGLKSLPDTLQYLHWDLFPITSLPRKFSPRNLVVLRLNHSNIQQLWQGFNVDVGNLKEVDLCDSKYLRTLPDLSTATQLELINLSNCVKLVELHLSILLLPKLKSLNLRNCIKVKLNNLDYYYNTNYGGRGRGRGRGGGRGRRSVAAGAPALPCLEDLNLERTAIKHVPDFIRGGGAPLLSALNCTGCTLFEFPVIPGVKQLTLNFTQIPRLPDHSGESLGRLEVLVFGFNRSLFRLSDDFTKWKSLKILDLSWCEELVEFPEIREPMESLSQLKLISCTKISRLPDSISNLIGLEKLDLSVTGIKQLPDSIGDLKRLSVLTVFECRSLVRLPSSLAKLPALQVLDIAGCQQLAGLRSDHLPKSLKHVGASGCKPEIQEIAKLIVPELDPDTNGSMYLMHSLTALVDLIGMAGGYS